MTAQPGTDLESVVVFRLGQRSFALAAEAIRELVPIAWLSKPPRMPSFVQGVLDLAGQAVPVLRLDALLGVEDARFGLDASILILRGERPLGLLAQRVDGVERRSAFRDLPVVADQSFNGCVAAVLEDERGAVSLIDLEKLLLAEETARLAEFQAHAQARLADLVEGEV